MKLSEAIRLGAMVRPQVRHTFFGAKVLYGFDGPYKVLGSCALGAAWEASGGDTLSSVIIGFEGRFPVLRRITKSPIGSRNSVEAIIVELNDSERWTREQIADWVESVELAQEVKTEELEVAHAAQ